MPRLFLRLAPVRILSVIGRRDLPRYAIYLASLGGAIGVFAGSLPGWMIMAPGAVVVFAIGDARVPRVGGSRKEIDPGKSYPEAVTAYPNRSALLLLARCRGGSQQIRPDDRSWRVRAERADN